MFVTVEEPTLTHIIITQSSQVTLGFTLDIRSVGVDKFIVMYSLLQCHGEWFPALQSFCTPVI